MKDKCYSKEMHEKLVKLIPGRKACFLCHRMEKIWKNEIMDFEKKRRDEAFFIRMKHLIEKEVSEELSSKRDKEDKNWKLFKVKYPSEDLQLEKF